MAVDTDAGAGPEAPVSTAVWDAAFRPLSNDALPTAVAKRLKQAIALGLLPNGGLLPSETDLALQLGVSKTTLRSALVTLREQGLVETRRGRAGGTFVVRDDQSDRDVLSQQLADWRLDDLRDLRDLHEAVAGAAAALAAARVRGATLDRLVESARALDASRSDADALRADFRFHLELVAATRSAQLTRVEMTIQSEIAPLLWIPGAAVCEPGPTAKAHLAIMKAVQDRDPDNARTRAEEHVSEALNGLIELRMRMDEDGR